MAAGTLPQPRRSAYGSAAKDQILSEDVTPRTDGRNASHLLVLQSFRLLIADLCQQFNGGHPG